jgi:hypothetical protein
LQAISWHKVGTIIAALGRIKVNCGLQTGLDGFVRSHYHPVAGEIQRGSGKITFNFFHAAVSFGMV